MFKTFLLQKLINPIKSLWSDLKETLKWRWKNGKCKFCTEDNWIDNEKEQFWIKQKQKQKKLIKIKINNVLLN